jgi:hypothetical protein
MRDKIIELLPYLNDLQTYEFSPENVVLQDVTPCIISRKIENIFKELLTNSGVPPDIADGLICLQNVLARLYLCSILLDIGVSDWHVEQIYQKRQIGCRELAKRIIKYIENWEGSE